MSIKSNRRIQVMSIVEYVNNKAMQESFLFELINGVGRYVINGERFTREDIEAKYPMPELLFYSENSDRTKDFYNKP